MKFQQASEADFTIMQEFYWGIGKIVVENILNRIITEITC